MEMLFDEKERELHGMGNIFLPTLPESASPKDKRRGTRRNRRTEGERGLPARRSSFLFHHD